MRQQDLSRVHIMLLKTGFINLREAHLTDRRACLQFMNTSRPLVESEPLHAFCNRPRTDQHNFFSQAAQMNDLFCPFLNGGSVEPLAVIGDERGADLDNDAFGFLNDGLHVLKTGAISFY